MTLLIPVSSESDYQTVTNSAVDFDTVLVANSYYLFTSSTNCFIKQGTAYLVTCTTKANAADTDFFTITLSGVATVYEFDKAGDGVTTGRVQVDISTDTTAAEVAARLRTAILANQTTLSVTDNTDGTLTIVANGKHMSMSENVAHASFTLAVATLVASAADTSVYVGANQSVLIDGALGPQVGTIRDTADGKSTLTRVKFR